MGKTWQKHAVTLLCGKERALLLKKQSLNACREPFQMEWQGVVRDKQYSGILPPKPATRELMLLLSRGGGIRLRGGSCARVGALFKPRLLQAGITCVKWSLPEQCAVLNCRLGFPCSFTFSLAFTQMRVSLAAVRKLWIFSSEWGFTMMIVFSCWQALSAICKYFRTVQSFINSRYGGAATIQLGWSD